MEPPSSTTNLLLPTMSKSPSNNPISAVDTSHPITNPISTHPSSDSHSQDDQNESNFEQNNQSDRNDQQSEQCDGQVVLTVNSSAEDGSTRSSTSSVQSVIIPITSNSHHLTNGGNITPVKNNSNNEIQQNLNPNSNSNSNFHHNYQPNLLQNPIQNSISPNNPFQIPTLFSTHSSLFPQFPPHTNLQDQSHPLVPTNLTGHLSYVPIINQPINNPTASQTASRLNSPKSSQTNSPKTSSNHSHNNINNSSNNNNSPADRPTQMVSLITNPGALNTSSNNSVGRSNNHQSLGPVPVLNNSPQSTMYQNFMIGLQSNITKGGKSAHNINNGFAIGGVSSSSGTLPTLLNPIGTSLSSPPQYGNSNHHHHHHQQQQHHHHHQSAYNTPNQASTLASVLQIQAVSSGLNTPNNQQLLPSSLHMNNSLVNTVYQTNHSLLPAPSISTHQTATQLPILDINPLIKNSTTYPQAQQALLNNIRQSKQQPTQLYPPQSRPALASLITDTHEAKSLLHQSNANRLNYRPLPTQPMAPYTSMFHDEAGQQTGHNIHHNIGTGANIPNTIVGNAKRNRPADATDLSYDDMGGNLPPPPINPASMRRDGAVPYLSGEKLLRLANWQDKRMEILTGDEAEQKSAIRKQTAESRPRKGGRFIKKTEAEKIAAQKKKQEQQRLNNLQNEQLQSQQQQHINTIQQQKAFVTGNGGQLPNDLNLPLQNSNPGHNLNGNYATLAPPISNLSQNGGSPK